MFISGYLAHEQKFCKEKFEIEVKTNDVKHLLKHYVQSLKSIFPQKIVHNQNSIQAEDQETRNVETHNHSVNW